VHIVAVKIHVTAALEIFYVDTVTGLQGIETRGGKGLFEKITLIFRKQVPGGRIDILLLPTGSQGGNVDIAFGFVLFFHDEHL